MELIQITRDNKRIAVSKSDYVRAKFLDLKESFCTLKQETVSIELEKILAGKSEGGMISAFIQDDDPAPIEQESE